jgi:hypothetical protein
MEVAMRKSLLAALLLGCGILVVPAASGPTSATPLGIGANAARFGSDVELVAKRGGQARPKASASRNVKAHKNVGKKVNVNKNVNVNRNVTRSKNVNVNRSVNVNRNWGNWARPARYRWAPGGAIAAGAAIGFVTAATAAAWAGPAPGPGLCWY